MTTIPNEWFPRPLPRNVSLGERSWLYSSYAFLHFHSERPCGLRLGDDSGVYEGTVFELGPEGEVEVGDFCTLAGPIICLNGRLVIGDYTLISYDVVIADSHAAIPPDSMVHTHDRADDGRAGRGVRGGDIVIGENAWIGTRAVVLAGARIGDGAIVGASAVVDFEVPPFAIVAGNPGAVVGESRPGERRSVASDPLPRCGDEPLGGAPGGGRWAP